MGLRDQNAPAEIDLDKTNVFGLLMQDETISNEMLNERLI